MKIKANKILAVLCVVAMIMTMIVPMTLTASAAEATASKTVAELITQYGWTSNTTKQTFKLDDNVTVKINGGSNTGKAYNGDHIRIYATDTPAGTITISVPDGYELSSVKISTQTGTYAYLYVDGTTTDISNKTVSVSGNSVVLKSVKNGSNGKQVRVTALEVKYTIPDSGDCDHANTTVLEAVPATCTTTGLTAGVKCADCDVILTAQDTVPTLEHVYVDNVCACGEIKPDTTLTIAQAIALGEAKAHNNYTDGKYYVTGVVTDIQNTQYGNIVISDGTDEILIYGTYSADGSTRYDAMDPQPALGDTMTVYGVIGQYNGTAQLKNAWVTELVSVEAPCEHENTSVLEGKDATCTETGLTDGEICDDCDKVLVEQEEIPTLPHDFVGGSCIECGEEEKLEATITFDDTSKRTEYSTTTQVWEENGITITNNKGASTTNIGDYSNPARFYKNSTVIIAGSGVISQIIIDASGMDAKYATPWVDSLPNYTVTDDGNHVYTIENVNATSIEFVTTAQIRANSITLVYAAAETVEIDDVNANLSVAYKYVENNGVLSDSQFVLKCGVDASLANVKGATAYGIAVTAGGKTVYYTSEAASWTVGDDVIYVSIGLGDIINDTAKLSTEFTVAAFVEVAGDKIESTSVKTYSVAGMIDAYNDMGIEEVEHLYNVLVGYGLI